VTSLVLRDCSSSVKMKFSRVDNSLYIALYAVICFLKLNSF